MMFYSPIQTFFYTDMSIKRYWIKRQICDNSPVCVAFMLCGYSLLYLRYSLFILDRQILGKKFIHLGVMSRIIGLMLCPQAVRRRVLIHPRMLTNVRQCSVDFRIQINC